MRGKTRRWIGFVAASLGLHLLALVLVQPTRVVVTRPPSAASLEWVDLPRPPDVPHMQARRPRPPAEYPPSERIPAPAESYKAESEPSSPIPARQTAPVPVPAAPPSLDMVELREQARTMARESAKSGEAARYVGDSPDTRPVLPALERALKREPAGVYDLGHGLKRVVARDGREYCLQSPPEFARDGPVGMLSVPTNCP